MDLIIAGLFFGVAVFFYLAGGYLRNLLWLFIGGAALLLLGINTLATGISYQDFNTTNTAFTFSADYFEFANDTVSCSNCSSVVYNESSNTTPPTCCAHDVNTTISGTVVQEIQTDTYAIALSSNEQLTFGLFFLCAGLLTVLEMAIQWNRERDGAG